MEKLKMKHDHKATKALQITLFFIMMLAPILAVGIKCAYTIMNPNAAKQYSAEKSKATYDDENYTIEINKEIINKKFISLVNLIQSNTQVRPIESLTYQETNYNFGQINTNVVYWSGNGTINLVITDIWNGFEKGEIYLYQSQTTIQRSYLNENLILNCNEPYYEQVKLAIENDVKIYKTENEYIDNVFYYATEQLNEQKLFNWTQETGIYSAINTMLVGFDMGTGAQTLCLLLTYWALISAIYIVFDIIIFCFTKLTHLIQ